MFVAYYQTLDIYSASAEKEWKRSFEEPQGPAQTISKVRRRARERRCAFVPCSFVAHVALPVRDRRLLNSQRIDAKDLTIFLDRYTRSDLRASDVYRKVVGYEVPVLTRTSLSARTRVMMKPRAAASEPAKSPDDTSGSAVALLSRPSVVCDPFFVYSCSRSKIKPMYEVDIFVGDLTFSLSDRQLEMVAQLLKIASTKGAGVAREADHSLASPLVRPGLSSDAAPKAAPEAFRASAGRGDPTLTDAHARASNAPSGKESWFGWAMNVLGGGEGEEEDALESEIIAETKEALLRASTTLATEATAAAKAEVKEGPFSLISCLRLCFRSVSLTLRKHPQESQDDSNQSDTSSLTITEELVPVANIGMVRVPVQTTKSRVSRPATPLCTLRMSYVALEGIFVQGEEQKVDLVFEIERVELLLAPRESTTRSSGVDASPLFQWGSVDEAAFASCVSHPYFISSFYGEESRRLNRRETRSFELVKVSFDTEIPVWRTLEPTESSAPAFDYQAACGCYIVWEGVRVPCTPASVLYRVSDDINASIGLSERTLDGSALLTAITTASTNHKVPLRPTDKLRDAATAIADEYKRLRSPDLGAVENLQQLLQPQVLALLGRESLHTCGAESLSSSCRSDDIRRRSGHSAIRLRFSTSRRKPATITDGDEEVGADANRTTSVIDISLGQADGSLDPSHCTEVVKLLTAFVTDVAQPNRPTKNGRHDIRASESELLTKDTTAKAASSRSDSVMLITFSRLHLKASHDQQDLVRLGVLIRDAVYYASSSESTTKKTFSVGELSATCTPPCGVQLSESVVQLVGVECIVSDERKRVDGELEHRMNALVTVDRATVSTNDESTFRACVTANELADAVIGYSFLHDPRFEPVSRHDDSVFRLDLCGARVSFSQADGCRWNPLKRRTLDAEILSLLLSSSKLRDPKHLRTDFHSGWQPSAVMLKQEDSGRAQPFIVLSLRDQQTAGVSCFVPFVPSSLLAASELPTRDSRHAPSYDLRVALRIAHFDASLKRVLNAASSVTNASRTIAGCWKHQPRKARNDVLQIPHPILRARTNQPITARWTLFVDLSSSGGVVQLNECVDLSVPAIRVSSSTEPSKLPRASIGGSALLVWSCDDLEVNSMAPSADGLKQRQAIVSLNGLRGQIAYIHRVNNATEHTHAIEGAVEVAQVRVELSRLTVRCHCEFLPRRCCCMRRLTVFLVCATSAPLPAEASDHAPIASTTLFCAR